MKKRLLLASVAILALVAAGSASAADLGRPVYKAPPPVAPPPFSWTGFYIGAHIGGAFSDRDWTDAITGETIASQNFSSFIGGGQVGYNYQVGSWVFGVEGDISGVAMNDSVTCFFGTLVCKTEDNFLATATGRLGYAYDHWLWYVKGGGAWTRDELTITDPLTGVSLSASNTRGGWTVGGGVEYAFAPAWSAKLEYDFMDFGDRSFTFTDGFVLPVNVHRDQINVVKFGVNYHFFVGPY